MSISIVGDNRLVPSGEYVLFGDKVHYVPAKEMKQSMKLKGFADQSLLMNPVLAFQNSEQGYQLVVKKSCDSAIYAKENADKSWSVLNTIQMGAGLGVPLWDEHDSLRVRATDEYPHSSA